LLPFCCNRTNVNVTSNFIHQTTKIKCHLQLSQTKRRTALLPANLHVRHTHRHKAFLVIFKQTADYYMSHSIHSNDPTVKISMLKHRKIQCGLSCTHHNMNCDFSVTTFPRTSNITRRVYLSKYMLQGKHRKCDKNTEYQKLISYDL
jgi:hypothetical protein